MSEYYYIGCFLDETAAEEMRSHRIGTELSRPNRRLHMTIKVDPETVDEELFGENIRLRVIGYGIDENNEGFLVEAYSDNEEIQRLIDTIEIPHVTMSISTNAKHRNTRYLEFQPIEAFEVTGTYGGYIRSGDKTGFLVLKKGEHSEVEAD